MVNVMLYVKTAVMTSNKKGNTMEDFVIYSGGICFCSVCSRLSLEETTKRVNNENPTGISSNWQLSERNFDSGETNPCACNDYPETHKHYLFEC